MNLNLISTAALAVLAFMMPGVPASPATFSEESLSVPIRGGHLSGSLMLPAARGPFPVALIVAGSGPVDRDGNSGAGLNTNTYKKLAQDLALNGVATLRYDKRGVGASSLSQAESDVRLSDFVDDALAFAALLEHDRRFSSVSIVGHSEGSLIGILAIQPDANIKALISLAGPGRNLAAIIDEQVRANPNNPPYILAEVASINAALMAGRTFPNPDPLLAPLFRPSVQPYLISEYAHDPAQEIAKLHIPILVIQGTTDIQIRTTDAELLAAAAGAHAKLLLIEGMNHILVDAPADRTKNVTTYSDPTLPLDAKLVPAIVQALLPAA